MGKGGIDGLELICVNLRMRSAKRGLVDLGVEGLEVVVGEGEIAVAFIEGEAAEEGFAGGIDLAEDAGVAGKIVVEDGFLAK
jgi:hypothetical protein